MKSLFFRTLTTVLILASFVHAQDTLPPIIISPPTVINVTDSTATIAWKTDELSNSIVEYGLTTAYGSTVTDNEDVLFHNINLTLLSPTTTYQFRVQSIDSEGNAKTSSNFSFTTGSNPDTIPPYITSPPTVTFITNNTAIIDWITNEPSTSILQYGLTSNLWDMYPMSYFDPDMVTKHRAVIENLDSEKKYFLRVGGTDNFNNGPNSITDDNNPSAEIFFITKSAPDIIAPLITTPPTAAAKTDTVAIIEWSTDELSNSIVQYGLTSSEWGAYEFINNSNEIVVNHRVVLTNLSPGQLYYFRVSSVDEYGNGSDGSGASSETFFVTNLSPDNAAPRITVPSTVTGITKSTATIEWETDEPANSEVRYLLVPEAQNEPQMNWADETLIAVRSSSMVTRHSVMLTNLKREDGNRRYYFMVGSTDATGWGPNNPAPDDINSNNPFTQDFFYIENASDERAPKIISGPKVSKKDNQSAIIEWETDEPGNSIVKYGSIGNTWQNFFSIKNDARMVTNHNIVITNLQPSKTYYYRVGSNDEWGNGPELNQDVTNPSGLYEFNTEVGPDIVAPIISDIRDFYVTNTTALITWETDEPSNSIIQYGVSSTDWNAYAFEESAAGTSSYHSITITGLQPDTLYYFRTGSTDAKGNGPFLNPRDGNPSNEMTFTSAAGPDITAPQISNFRVASKTDKTAVIEWTTDEPSNSQVRYDTTSRSWQDYASSENDAEMVTHHSVTLTNLSPGTLYYVRVSSTDASGNNYATSLTDQNPSIEYNFGTSDEDPPSIVVYPDADRPRMDTVRNTIDITYDEPNMQNASVESNYIFSPDLTFAEPGNSIQEICSTDEGSTYQLSFVSVPQYTIFTLTAWEEITDADGYSLEPATILINDNDGDNLPDDWESEYCLDPTNSNDEHGKEGDFDGDSFSNYDEFVGGTDPCDSFDPDIEPTANITSPESDIVIKEGQSVSFKSAQTSGNLPITYLWDFDGGATNSNLKDPGDVKFMTPGIYSVVFIVTDADNDSATDTVEISVNKSSSNNDKICFINILRYR